MKENLLPEIRSPGKLKNETRIRGKTHRHISIQDEIENAK